MPLKIHIKKGQQVIINGAVLENAGAKTVSLVVKNDATILRDSDIVSPDDAATPASRTYYALQCVYLFPEKRDHYLQVFNELSDSFARAVPSSGDIVASAKNFVEAGQYYNALKKARELIAHEGKVLSHVE